MLPMCLGTFQQRDGSVLNNVVNAAILSGIRMFDTAPSYKTEFLLGDALHKSMQINNVVREELIIIDKIDGWQMQDGNLLKHIEFSLKKMRLEFFDVLLIHWPFPDYLINTWKQFEQLKTVGKAKRIGLCNVRCKHITKLIDATGIIPDYIQIERHPLWNSNKEVEYCKKNGIKVMGYSPLCRMDKRLLNASILSELSKKYQKTISQIILRWHIDTDCIPVFMTKNPDRISEHTNIFDFSLDTKEIERINELDSQLKLSVESWGCPGF